MAKKNRLLEKMSLNELLVVQTRLNGELRSRRVQQVLKELVNYRKNNKLNSALKIREADLGIAINTRNIVRIDELLDTLEILLCVD